MNDEFFDVVNERDEPVARARRSEVHARSLLHRSVHVFVFNPSGEVFLQKRSLAKDKCPGLWDASCSGHVDAGEAYDDAAVRELREELGVTVGTPLKRWFRVNACEETGWEFIWIYRLGHEGPFVLHPEEIDTGEWMAPAELTRRMRVRPQDYTPAFRLLWSIACREKLG